MLLPPPLFSMASPKAKGPFSSYVVTQGGWLGWVARAGGRNSTKTCSHVKAGRRGGGRGRRGEGGGDGVRAGKTG